MSEPQIHPALFSQVEISAASMAAPPRPEVEQTLLLRQILAGQERQAQLLEAILNHFTSQQRQRNQDLAQWKETHPHLAKRCRDAAETLSRVQNEFVDSMATEVNDNGDTFMDGEYMLHEFVDRFGSRLAHLNNVLQVLGQLAAPPLAPPKPNETP